MKRMWISVMVVGFVVASFGMALAASNADEAKAMVEKAAAYYQANGKEKALKEFNNPKGQFVKGDLYVFAYDMSGTIIAHPVNPKLVGINTLETPDVDGKMWRKEGMEMVKKSGTAWVDYKFKNPVSGKIEQKTTYLKKVGDSVLGCGAYK
ncbi:MAG: cache domain-containing protein [Deltaproteobacteria bacterium]|nr:cache domain-containing protein [Deltaproteobacteria bacterium]